MTNNLLEKIFNSIKNRNNSDDTKIFATNHLITLLPEYSEYILYILTNIEVLLYDTKKIHRECGGRLLKEISCRCINFNLLNTNNLTDIENTFSTYYSTNNYIFLATKDYTININSNNKKNKSKIDNTLKTELNLEYVESDKILLDTATDYSSKKFKTNVTVPEKEINKVEDFFSNLMMNMLSPEWYKRHGAFMGVRAIFNSINFMNSNVSNNISNNLIVDVDIEEVTHKTLLIFMNDKFNDYLNNKAHAPVREEASELMYEVVRLVERLEEEDFTEDIPILEEEQLKTNKLSQTNKLSLKNNKPQNILKLLFTLLSSTHCWHTQYAILNYILVSINSNGSNSNSLILNYLSLNKPLLTNIFRVTQDEDIKYLCGEIINTIILNSNNIFNNTEIEDISKICVEQLSSTNKNNNNFSNNLNTNHAKEQLIILTKNILTNYNITNIFTNYDILMEYYTSYNRSIREAVVEITEYIESIELTYVLGENMLFYYYSNNSRNITNILSKKLSKLSQTELDAFISYFLSVINGDIFCFYDRNNFLTHEDNYFTRDGWMVEGYGKIMDGRVRLLRVITNIIETNKDRNILSENSNDILINKNILSLTNSILINKLTKNTKKAFINSEIIKEDYNTITDLKINLPMTDLITLLNNKDKINHSNTFNTRINTTFTNYLRLNVCRNILSAYNYITYVYYEYSVEYIDMIFNRLIENKTHIKTLKSIIKNMSESTNEIFLRNSKRILKILDESDYTDIFEEYLNNSSNIEILNTYAHITDKKILNYSISGRAYEILLDEIFGSKVKKDNLIDSKTNNNFDSNSNKTNNSINNNCIELLNNFIKNNISYNIKYIKRIVNANNVIFSTLVAQTIDNINNNCIVLLLKHILKDINSSTSEILSKIIGRIYLMNEEDLQEIKEVDEDIYGKIVDAYKEIEMLIDSTKIKEYEIEQEIFRDKEFKLRNYQMDGIRWMHFIFRFNLGGILADDMGLGKTVQVLGYMYSERYKMLDKNSEDLKIKDKNMHPTGVEPTISYSNISTFAAIIICPNSLQSHWISEINDKFISGIYEVTTFINNNKDNKNTILVTTYNVIRKLSTNLTSKYLILDEGHMLRNRKSVLYSKIINNIHSIHKLILSGTPVHNSVDDLYSLFNIVIPNYLGDDKEFSKKYRFKVNEKNISKNEKEQKDINNVNENSNSLTNKMNNLHKKVLPFILRRLKTDVLKDLPPKIIKDVMIEMSEEHRRMYNDITMSCNNKNDDNNKIEETNNINDNSYSYTKSTSINVRNLVKAASHIKYCSPSTNSINCKTLALFDIFDACGGISNMKHKVIIFFQYKKTLEYVVEEIVNNYDADTVTEVLAVLSVEKNYSHFNNNIKNIGEIASYFNNTNKSILLSTSAVGGLGLNLTSADTVVFYEHDWNPFNDLQAMDRAHRLGQKTTVNVFRLLVVDTIEEKVMNYQNFKKYVTSKIITQQNTNVEEMEMGDILEKI